ncbi:MAG: Bro-N domain-containing protein [Patescibacteria group bacterium]
MVRTTETPALFEQTPIRRVWDEKEEKWWFSVVDVVGILAESADARKYWNKLAQRLREEGSEVVTKCHQLKLLAADGKMRLTDVAETQTLFRIIQSIPSPKAEPFKLWLAKVGYERIKETADPQIAVDRARKHWKKMGRSEKWIEMRMRGIELRNKLTDYWNESGVKEGKEYAILTDIIHQEWSELTTKQHKHLKGLQAQNLRDHMDDAELIFTALAELSTNQIAKSDEAKGFDENTMSAHKGGRISGNARKALENQTGKKVVSGENFLPPKKKIKRLT